MKVVTVRELSQKLELSNSALSPILCRFGKYSINDPFEWKREYMYNKEFLTELKDFFTKKMYYRNGQYFTKYYRAVQKLKTLIEEMG